MKLFVALVLTAVLAGCNPQEGVPPAQSPSPASTSAPAKPAADPLDYKIVNWGQQGTAPGAEFNVQRDGNSGISFELNQPVPTAEITATFDGKSLTGIATNGVIVTATIPGEFLAEAGTYPVELQIPDLGKKIPVGNFEVK